MIDPLVINWKRGLTFKQQITRLCLLIGIRLIAIAADLGNLKTHIDIRPVEQNKNLQSRKGSE